MLIQALKYVISLYSCSLNPFWKTIYSYTLNTLRPHMGSYLYTKTKTFCSMKKNNFVKL